MKLYQVAFLAILCVGCASKKFSDKTAKMIKCSESDLKISSVNSGPVESRWVAKCESETYYCHEKRLSNTKTTATCTTDKPES